MHTYISSNILWRWRFRRVSHLLIILIQVCLATFLLHSQDSIVVTKENGKVLILGGDNRPLTLDEVVELSSRTVNHRSVVSIHITQNADIGVYDIMPLVEALFKSGYSHVYLSIMNKMESQILLNIDLKKSHFQTVSPIPPAPGVDSYIESSRAPRTIKHETYGIELARIHPGEFITSISNGGSIERANVVFIPRHYYISKYEITQKQYYLVTGKATKHRASDSLPIDGLSFEAAMEFCSKLGHGYRLPTEHEWEYAARGCGERTGADSYDYYIYSGSNNIDDVAWYVENSEGRVHPIGLKKANEYGLYDMSGNVFEWCIVGNGKDKTKGVLRGGNYASIARDCRTTVVVRTNEIKGGFRIVYDPHQKNENVKRDGNSPTGGTMP